MVFSKTIISRISEEVENIMLKKVENKESKKMILLTNDDGIEAPGIKALFYTFIKFIVLYKKYFFFCYCKLIV